MNLKRMSQETALLLVSAVAGYGQGVIAITSAKILTVSHGEITNGTVLIKDGKISAVGSGLAVPAGATEIDGRGKVVMPGMIDAGDQLGLVEVPFERVTDDSTEYTDPIHPELRVADAFNSRSENIRVARPAGITDAVVTPAGGNLIAGLSAVVQLASESPQDFILKSPAALFINLGEQSKETYGNKDKAPATRMAEIAMLRQAFLDAQRYVAEKKIGNPQARNLKMDALELALKRDMPVVVRANRSSDIEAALRLADEFGLHLVLSEAASAWRFADQLAAKKIPVIVGPIFQAPMRIESEDMRLDNIAILQRAGVLVALQTESSNGVRDLWFAAGYAIAHGLPEPAALQSVTRNPAEIFGMWDRLGSIDVGKDATLLVLDGEPFRATTHATSVIIGGVVVDLSNHQTELYEQYKKKYAIQ